MQMVVLKYIGKNVVIIPTSIIFAEPSGDTGKINIEDNCLLGSGVHIYASNHNFCNTEIDIYYQGQQEVKDVILRGVAG